MTRFNAGDELVNIATGTPSAILHKELNSPKTLNTLADILPYCVKSPTSRRYRCPRGEAIVGTPRLIIELPQSPVRRYWYFFQFRSRSSFARLSAGKLNLLFTDTSRLLLPLCSQEVVKCKLLASNFLLGGRQHWAWLYVSLRTSAVISALFPHCHQHQALRSQFSTQKCWAAGSPSRTQLSRL